MSGDHLIHFTGRNGLRINVDPAILRLSPGDRLLEIIMRGVIFGSRTFGAGAPVVCLTEVSDHVLTVKGEHKEKTEEQEKAFRLHERLEHRSNAEFELPPAVETKS